MHNCLSPDETSCAFLVNKPFSIICSNNDMII
jgi:hypothetical protein